MYTKGVLTIDNWQQGVADSATLGFGSINNAEVYETPGTLKIAPASLRMFPVSSPDSLPIAFTEDTTGNIYFLSSAGTLYRTSGGLLYSLQTGLSGANDIIFYRDYVWVSYGNSGGIVGLYGPTSGGASWFGSVVTGLSSSFKKFVVCQSDIIYMSNGTNIKFMASGSAGSYLPSFTPAAAFVTPTVTFQATGWSVPGSYANVSGSTVTTQAITTMIEYGTNLVLGTTTGNIYQWDRADTQLTDVPFKFSSGQINQMITKENVLYITSGTRGNVYRGDGTNFVKMQKIKWRQRRPYTSTVSLNPNAIALSPFGTLLIGTSTGTDSFPSTSMHGIHEIQLQPSQTGYSTVFKNAISTGNTGTSQALYIGFVATSNGITYVGWQDGSTYGFDWIGGTGGGVYTSAYCESPLYPIATRLDEKTFQKLEWKLATPLIAGQSVSVQFRGNTTDTYDTARVYSYTNLGAVYTHTDTAKLSGVTNLQCKITLTSPTGVGDTNVELLNVTLW